MTEFKSFTAPPVSRKEQLRYAHARNDCDASELLGELLQKSESVLNYNVCFSKLTFTLDDDVCNFGGFSLNSRSLAKNLAGCKFCIVFLASVGHGIDRLIAKYKQTSPAKALLLDAIGTERVESLCDSFCDWLREEYPEGVTKRFSPGYGDLALDVQKDIFALLSPERSMAVYLGDKLLMSPTKSVTAFVGIKDR